MLRLFWCASKTACDQWNYFYTTRILHLNSKGMRRVLLDNQPIQAPTHRHRWPIEGNSHERHTTAMESAPVLIVIGFVAMKGIHPSLVQFNYTQCFN